MADARFFRRSGPFALSQIVELTGAALPGGANDAHTFDDVAPLPAAGADDISFFDNIKYLDAFRSSHAGACFVRQKFVEQAPKGMLTLAIDDPYAAYARTAQLFYPPGFKPFVSPKAHIFESAEIGRDCRIEAGAWIGENVLIGDNCYIGPNATISHAIIGSRCIIHAGAHIGQDGFGFAPSKTGLIKVPQLGRVMIGNDVEIGAGTCIDRGAGPDTVILDGAKIDNLVQVGHNCHIGRFAVVVGQVGLSGSTRIEDFAMIGGQCGFAGHTTVGKGAKVAEAAASCATSLRAKPMVAGPPCRSANFTA